MCKFINTHTYTYTHRWTPGDEHRMGAGTVAGTETTAAAEMGTGKRIRKATRTRTGSGGVEERRRSAEKLTRVVDMIGHFPSARVVISAEREWRFRASDNSVCKARNLYTCIVPWG